LGQIIAVELLILVFF